MSFEFSKNFIASASHITERDSSLLELGTRPSPVTVYEMDSGFLVDVMQEEGFELLAPSLRQHGFSEAFTELLRLARQEGCAFLLLDGEGPTYDGLPLFDW